MEEENLRRPCPPAMDLVDAIRDYIYQLLGVTPENAEKRIVCMIPCQETETWIHAAFFLSGVAEELDVLECLDKPSRALYGKQPRFVRMKRDNHGKSVVKKVPRVYADNEGPLSQKWNVVCTHCSAAKLFSDELSEVL